MIYIVEKTNESTTAQLEYLGRTINTTPTSSMSLFTSVADQLGGRVSNPYHLKELVCSAAVTASHRFLRYLTPQNVEKFIDTLQDLKEDHTWTLQLRNAVLDVIQDLLGVKIVVIKNYAAPQYFPDDDLSITDDDIVIIQQRVKPHFDATKMKRAFRGKVVISIIKIFIYITVYQITYIYSLWLHRAVNIIHFKHTFWAVNCYSNILSNLFL